MDHETFLSVISQSTVYFHARGPIKRHKFLPANCILCCHFDCQAHFSRSAGITRQSQDGNSTISPSQWSPTLAPCSFPGFESQRYCSFGIQPKNKIYNTGTRQKMVSSGRRCLRRGSGLQLDPCINCLCDFTLDTLCLLATEE